LLLIPVPIGERRNSGMSAPHSIYLNESHLVVDVCVTAVKEGSVLGLVLEHLDEEEALIAAENISIFVAPRSLQHIAAAKGCRLRIKWILAGVDPSSTFSVTAEGISSDTMSMGAGPGEALEIAESSRVNLTTFRGLQDYLGIMRQEATA
jgi:hypothetical protein